MYVAPAAAYRQYDPVHVEGYEPYPAPTGLVQCPPLYPSPWPLCAQLYVAAATRIKGSRARL
ncbi:hypothetical protein PABY_22420 [Pyrodictium abyssi]|uniref:Uncharacterized protein n=1 Tax=Pyrodictium abyssi TaxID=54256 RepID=A0ABN6ZUJ3_9CREN|nr:hypothetical protein PABY_22420 [Pyrodictium abyssi]